MKSMNGWFMLLVFLMVLLFGQGCGVYMAFTQPEKVDQQVFESGNVPRDYVVEKLGVPKTTNKDMEGSKVEIYEFYEGSGSGWKIGRGIFHLVADIFTIGLWEIVATPTEFGVRGEKLTAEAKFDSRDTLVAFNVLGKNKKPTETVAGPTTPVSAGEY